MLRRLADQERRLDRLVVVDNDASAETREVVAQVSDPGDVEYVAAPENLGPAGGLALGMSRLMTSAADLDWIVCLDDDDPPGSRSVIGDLFAFARSMRARHPATGAVGIMGARFDERKGRMVRVPDDELRGPVRVDALAGNELPFYLVRALRDAGAFSPELFFGFEELEQGLRLRDAGYVLFADGDRWRQRRIRSRRLARDPRPSTTLAPLTWRRYYGLRNIVHILRSRGRIASAVRVSVVHGIAKPLANVPIAPRTAIEHLRQNSAACRDAWTGRMWRTVEPDTTDPKAAPGSDEGAPSVTASDGGIRG
jgi:glycosyltransferase involved in cell wall biosynthesis